MTTEIQVIDDQPRHAALSRWGRRFARFEGWLERVVDQLNPILVKECRQALKSRQFTITFALVLACCWLWSIYGVMSVGPAVQLGAAGMKMYFGYFTIMAFPLIVVVPYGAFRSLADECDDRTFDLLSITALGPRQIIAGKLGSAVVQIMVYLSAIAPCLAFTYLLRGIEAPTIFITVVYMFFASLGLSMVGLMAATAAQERHWQVLLSAAVVIGLGGLFIGTIGAVIEGLSHDRIAYDSPVFWNVNVGFALAYGSYFALFFLAAAARLTFPSENRSTPLRIVMFVQHLLLTFGIGWGIARANIAPSGYGFRSDAFLFEVLSTYLMLLSLHWYFMGSFLIGEMPRLSNRAKRGLPQSFLGRAFLTWFNPGSGSGYVFALANLASALLLLLGGIGYWRAKSAAQATIGFGGPMAFGSPARNMELTATLAVLSFGYVAFYLGLGRLLLTLLRRVAPLGMPVSVFLQALLLLVGCITPVLIDEIAGNRHYDYSLLYVFNPPATMAAVGRQVFDSGPPILIVLFAAGALFFANLRSIMAEVRQVRTEAPQRVIEEEETLHPKPVAAPVNPFE